MPTDCEEPVGRTEKDEIEFVEFVEVVEELGSDVE